MLVYNANKFLIIYKIIVSGILSSQCKFGCIVISLNNMK